MVPSSQRMISGGSRRRSARKGAAVLEMSLMLGLFLTVTMGMMDLGIGVLRYHLISQGARHTARRAIVHGELATALGTWGPSTIDVPLTANGIPAVDGAADGVKDMLLGCDPDKTRVRIEWPSGGNELNDPVRVTVTTPYQPFLTFIFPSTEVTLTAVSTMEIAH